ncbi:hypothetical protein RND71_034289 [Anisodus tanguticus]|uniref:Major facilitator superfamily (MFS) profile domain-containing protein n=1 Tax=Anisodus tanguticus TaxID=243964 RepID=A0AAE1V4V3_9SOLA|nr:hypothetical protein RND71_034289 [Anisodus tanguticus]
MAPIMERADENLLPAVYKEVSETFKAGPSDLGYLTFIRNFVQGIASPVAGILVINYDCPTVLAIGILCWSLSTGAVGSSKYFMQVGFWRAVNGFGLAIIIPVLQSFIADSYMDESWGTGFGFLGLVGTVGGIGGGAIATVMAGYEFWGIPGWRFAFVMMATFSILIAFLVFTFVVDPRKRGSIEFDHNSAAALVSLFAAGCAIESFFGGVVADRISVSSYYAFAVTLFLMGLTISWNSTASSGPLFAEVVPSKQGPPVVGILAEKLYGYDTKSVDPVLGSAKEALELSKGLFSMMALPFGLCCLFYTPLYWTFKKDRENARIASIKETEMI